MDPSTEGWARSLSIMDCVIRQIPRSGSPEPLRVEFRIFTHDQPLRDFHIGVDDDVSQARGAADIDAGKNMTRILHVCKRIHPRAR